MDIDLTDLKNQLDEKEQETLSKKACLSRSAVRRRTAGEAQDDHRQNFAIDVDRILHSLVYTRYIDKTQVFYLIRHDHISHRVLHVQLVSRIARTVGRYLELNLDLIEAISLGHDLGHAPFGHDGESFLTKLCLDHGIGHFVHSVQSLEFLERIERNGQGLNLSLQVLDGIMCHDGEVDLGRLEVGSGLTFDLLDERGKQKKQNPEKDFQPSTREGCVVRLADTISYIGRDIEDAIMLGLIKREDLPEPSVRILGRTNGRIVYSLVTDLIKTSLQRDSVGFSEEKTEALTELKNFNRERIYYNKTIKTETPKIERLYGLIFENLLKDLEQENADSPIGSSFAGKMAREYLAVRKNPEIVRDFIAGMTDQYFLNMGQRMLMPQHQDPRFE